MKVRDLLPAINGLARTNAARALLGIGLLVGLTTAPTLAKEVAPAKVASCFDSSLDGSPLKAQAAASIVHVVTINADGNSIESGTGFVVRDSAGSDHHLKIVTAWHVTRMFEAGLNKTNRLIIEAPSGEPIAFVAVSGRGSGAGRSATAPLAHGDVVVLSATTFMRNGAAIYDAIPGLPLAPRQSARLMGGMIASPSGIDFGASGSPIIGLDGFVHGLTVVKRDLLRVPNVVIRAGSLVKMNQDDHHAFIANDITLPLFSDVFAEPISEPSVLSALNGAGASVTVGSAPEDTGFQVVMPAIPNGICIIFGGYMYAAEPGDDSARARTQIPLRLITGGESNK